MLDIVDLVGVEGVGKLLRKGERRGEERLRRIYGTKMKKEKKERG